MHNTVQVLLKITTPENQSYMVLLLIMITNALFIDSISADSWDTSMLEAHL